MSGVTNSVSKVAKCSPKIIVAAMPPKAISNSNGTIPRMVVVAAISTGRVRETVDSITASVSRNSFAALNVDFVYQHDNVF